MRVNFLSKNRSMEGIFQLQYMIMQNEISTLTARCNEVEVLRNKCHHEYLSILEEITELQQSFNIILDSTTQNNSFKMLNKKYNEFLIHKKLVCELKTNLQHKMNVLVVQKRKIDHFNHTVRKHQLSISYKYSE
ncbi:hypothetical protein [Acinetobacter sp. 3657]|uniref:hypothetical protein n=1 Tax=Acinetobacter sp. 3657 TaxID=2817764 RepID=UPI00285AE750|nr:hypothetical protein [Prolinoborus sp. 3657]